MPFKLGKFGLFMGTPFVDPLLILLEEGMQLFCLQLETSCLQLEASCLQLEASCLQLRSGACLLRVEAVLPTIEVSGLANDGL